MSNKKNSKQTFKAFALGSTIAALAGYLAGVLTAPKSGKQIRGDIADASDKSRKETEKQLKSLSDELNKLLKEATKQSSDLGQKAGSELKLLVEKAEDNKEKAREVLSAIHDGDAEDQDLKRAIKSASSALEHLKDYLDK